MVFIGGLATVETRKRLLEREELTSKETLEAAEALERAPRNPEVTAQMRRMEEQYDKKQELPVIFAELQCVDLRKEHHG
ncbi:hypothetical protein COOONC_01813 [Cooperia oncophora]